jgi:hypothetical protein
MYTWKHRTVLLALCLIVLSIIPGASGIRLAAPGFRPQASSQPAKTCQAEWKTHADRHTAAVGRMPSTATIGPKVGLDPASTVSDNVLALLLSHMRYRACQM